MTESSFGNFKIGNKDWKIKEVDILEFNTAESKYSFIVLANVNGKDELYISEIEGTVLKNQELIFSVDKINHFFIFGNDLFVVE